MWSTKGEKLQVILMRDYPASAFVSNWPQDVEQLLILLKLLPSKNTRHNNVEVFKKAIKKLIIFREVLSIIEILIILKITFNLICSIQHLVQCWKSKTIFLTLSHVEIRKTISSDITSILRKILST